MVEMPPTASHSRLTPHWLHSRTSALSHWLHDGMPQGQVRSREYIVPTLLTILLGGMQEPGHACGSTMLGLFTQPAQLCRVVEDKRLIPKAVQEGLRWLSPITTTMGRRPKQG
jgi:aromatic O-demethylase, cytochrome P450 subunit